MEIRKIDPKDRKAVWEVVLESTKLVGRPVFFSMAIIILAFIPVFALIGQEGKLFHPLAFTKTFRDGRGDDHRRYARAGSLHISARRKSSFRRGANPVMRFLRRLYEPTLLLALKHRVLAICSALVLFLGAIILAMGIGNEFMPPLNEGDVMYMPITDPSISIDEASKIMSKQGEMLKEFPEVETAVGKAGRAETSTDPAPTNMNETIVHLKPEDQWRDGMTREKLIAEMDEATRLPGVTNIWTQPIINRIEMLATGIRSQVGIKIFGNNLDTLLETLSRQVAESVKKVRGAVDVYPEQIGGSPYIDIKIDRPAAARYGIDVSEQFRT